MTATEELRRMFDERGVEWMDDSYAQLWCTVWNGHDGKQWRMTENQSGMLTELKAWQVTPEKVIAATLGSEREKALEELVRDMWFWSYEGHMDNESQDWQRKHIHGVLDRMSALGIEVYA